MYPAGQRTVGWVCRLDTTAGLPGFRITLTTASLPDVAAAAMATAEVVQASKPAAICPVTAAGEICIIHMPHGHGANTDKMFAGVKMAVGRQRQHAAPGQTGPATCLAGTTVGDQTVGVFAAIEQLSFIWKILSETGHQQTLRIITFGIPALSN